MATYTPITTPSAQQFIDSAREAWDLDQFRASVDGLSDVDEDALVTLCDHHGDEYPEVEQQVLAAIARHVAECERREGN